MDRGVTRRDVLTFLGGGIVGTVLSPIPWKLLDDAAIWTQNWSWLASPARGPVSTHHSHCTLCPAGCGLRVRCVGAQPVSVMGVARHPLGRGGLCPLGLTIHHLAYHPARLTEPRKRTRPGGPLASVPVALDEVLTAAATHIQAGPVGILDHRPGRVLSELYRRFLAEIDGYYLTGPSEHSGGELAAGRPGEPLDAFGLDLEMARVIVSFGAPILDGWGAPGCVAEKLFHRTLTERTKLIQVETRPSRTALRASNWLRIRPGTETALALGLAHVLIEEELYDRDFVAARAQDFSTSDGQGFRELLERFTPGRVAGWTGLSVGAIQGTARALGQNAPAVAIAGTDPGGGPLSPEAQRAIRALNLLLGNFGRTGGFVPRRTLPTGLTGRSPEAPAAQLAEIPDGSLRLLILDDAASGCAMPWTLIKQKLMPAGEVLCLTAHHAGSALQADWILPTPAPMEAHEEITVPQHAAAVFAIARPLLAQPPEVIEPVTLLNYLASVAGLSYVGPEGNTKALRGRAEAIFREGRGRLITNEGEETRPASSGAFWGHLQQGACWLAASLDEVRDAPFHFLGPDGAGFPEMLRAGETTVWTGRASDPLLLMPYGYRGTASSAALAPVMTKLHRESKLRAGAHEALMHPATGKELGLHAGEMAVLELDEGAIEILPQFDEAVLTGVIHLATGPAASSFGDVSPDERPRDCLTLCRTAPDGTWRIRTARVREV